MVKKVKLYSASTSRPRKSEEKALQRLLPVGSSIYSLSEKVLYLKDLPLDEYDLLCGHVYVPNKSYSEILFYVYLEEPEPCIVPLHFEGVTEKRKVKSRFWDPLGWFNKSVPAPPLVGVELNPGPCDIEDFPNILSVVSTYLLEERSSFMRRLEILYLIRPYSDKAYIRYLGTTVWRGVPMEHFIRRVISTFQPRLSYGHDRATWRDNMSCFDGICDTLIAYEQDVPAPRLVCIETNPGPTEFCECTDGFILSCVITVHGEQAVMFMRDEERVGNEEEGPFSYAIFHDSTVVKYHHRDFEHQFVNICVRHNADLLATVGRIVTVDGNDNYRLARDANGNTLVSYTYIPPAPRLVNVETNPGPFPLEIVEVIIDYLPLPEKPRFSEERAEPIFIAELEDFGDNWGDIALWEDEVKNWEVEVDNQIVAAMDTFVAVEKADYECQMDSILKAFIPKDALGINQATDSVKETASEFSNTLREVVSDTTDKFTTEGLKHVHVFPDEVVSILHSINEKLGGITLPDISSIISKFVALFPGMGDIALCWNENLDERTKRIMLTIVLGSMSCIVAKYDLSWKSKLMVCALQWGIAIKSEDEEVKKFLMRIHGIDALSNAAMAVINLVQGWYFNPDLDYEAHSNVVLEKVSFSTKHVLPILVKSIIAFITFGKCQTSMESFISSCKLYKQLTNGVEFTMTSMVDLVRRIFDMLGSSMGFKLFQEAYNDYPEIYRIMDCFDLIMNKLTGGERLTYRDLTSFKKSASLLLSLEKRISLKTADVVYQNQIRALRTACDSLKKTFGCQGLRANNYRLRPMVISLAGPSAIGKTPLMRLIMNGLAKFTSVGEDLQDFIDHPETYIHMWAECEFHDNMLPETIMLGIDDFAQTRKAATPETCPFRNLISIVNNAPYPVNCSDNSRKNTVFHQEELVVLSFNRDRFNVNDFHIYQIEAGLNRLGHCFRVEIKEEFRKTTGPEIDKNWGYTLDKDKVDTSAMNVHVYDFIEYNPHDGSVIASYNFADFMRRLAKYFIIHKEDEIKRMNELANSFYREDLNPLKDLSAFDIVGDQVTVHQGIRATDHNFSLYEAHMDNLAIESLIKKALEEYKEQEALKSATFNATRAEMQERFSYRMADPTDPLWYFSVVDGLFWQEIYSQDPGWARFVDDHIKELFDWMTGNKTEKFVKAIAFKQFSLTEIPHDVRVICNLFRLYYLRTKEMVYRYDLALTDVFNVAKTMDIDLFMKTSLQVLKDLAYMEIRSNLILLGDTWQGLFSFCGVWTRYLLACLPTIITAACVVENVVAHSGVRLKQVRVKPRKSPVVQKIDHAVQPVGEYVTQSVDISSMAMQAASVIHRNNEYGVYIRVEDTIKHAQSILFVEGRIALANTHLVKALDLLLKHNNDFVVILRNYHSQKEIPVMWRYVKCREIGTTDKSFMMFHSLTNVHNHKSIVKYLVDDSIVLEEGTNVLISLTRDNVCGLPERVMVVRPIRKISKIAYVGDVKDTYSYVGYDIDFPSKKGDCGATVYVSDTRYASSWYMIGIIAAGKVRERYATMTPISKQWMRKQCDEMHSTMESWIGMKLTDELNIPPESFVCSALPEKFIIERIDKACSQSDKTKYTKTRLFGLFSEATKYPAVQREYECDGVEYDPLYLARDKYCNSSGVYNPLIMMYAVTMYLITLLPILFSDYHIKPREFTPEEVTIGNGYVEATPRDTSEGYAYQQKKVTKAMLFGKDTQYDITNAYCVEMFENVKRDMCEENKGKVIRRVAKDFGKDETLPINKIEQGKLRLVSGTDVEDFTVDKCRLGFAVSLVTANPIYSGTAAGMNPYSTDWDKMYHYFDGFAIIAGDFKNWDGVVFLNIAYMVLYSIFSQIYYTYDRPQQLGLYAMFNAAATSLHAACFTTMTVIYLWISGLASGRYFTLVGNSMYNCVLLRYAFLICYFKNLGLSYLSVTEEHVVDLIALEKSIRVVTLGDDHVVGIREDIDWCTHQHFVEVFREHGIIYTDDTKTSGEVKPLRTMEEISFEQRVWRYCYELKRTVGPLKIDTLYNMLYWSKTNETNMREVAQTVVDEFSLWGSDVFDEHVPPIKNALVKHYGIVLARTDWKVCLYFITNSDDTFV